MAGMSVAVKPIMALTWQRATVGAVGATYFIGAIFLAGVATERIRADRERVAVIRTQVEQQRQARERAMRVELQHGAGRPAARTR